MPDNNVLETLNRQYSFDHAHVSNWTPGLIEKWAKDIAYQLDEPAVLTLNEITALRKDWNDPQNQLKFCMLLPVMYSAIIANLGVAIIYDELNRRNKGIIMERSYFPEKKLLVRMKKEGIPLFSKENFMPVQNFDVVGFSSFYPVQFLNIPTMLEMSEIPVLASERDGTNAPIVIGGGVSFFNPEPVTDFLDAAFIGEAEQSFSKALRILQECKTEFGIDKEKLLYRWTKETKFMYVPSFYEVKYFDGFGVKERIVKEEYKDIAKPNIHRATADLYNVKPLANTFVPVIGGGNMSVGSLEVARGCSAMCRFCEGAYRTYPYRERSYEAVKEGFDELIKNTGVKDVTPYSFNLSDFSSVRRILSYLLQDQDKKIQMSSQRIDMFDEGFARMAYLSGNRSITLAMEAGSQHMRNVINKNLTEQQILEAFESAFKIGFNKIKVYMIANLPFETEEDIENEDDSTIAIMRKIAERRDYWAQRNGKKCQLTFSYTPFTSKNGCLVEDTLVLTEKGFKELGSLKDSGLKIYDGETISELGFFYENGETETVKLTLSNGQILEGTLDHPLQGDPNNSWAIANNGYIPMGQFKPGMSLKRSFNTQVFGSQSLDLNKAFILGIASDSWLDKYDTIWAFNTEFTDEEVYATVGSAVKQSFEANSSVRNSGGKKYDKNTLYVCNEPFIHELKDLGVQFGIPRYKRTVPSVILASTKETQLAYLKGLFEADGSCNVYNRIGGKKIIIRLSSSSRPFISQIQLILNNLGFDSYIEKFERSYTRLDGTKGQKFTLVLKGGVAMAQQFKSEIGFISDRKQNSLNEACLGRVINRVKDLSFLTVVSVEHSKAKTYCINVPSTHQFIANGVISSNTPFQWAQCMGALKNKRTLSKAVEEARKCGIKFRVGTSAEIAVVAQVLTLGDRRLNKVIYRAVKEGILSYFGGMSVGKDVLPAFEKLLKEETGHTFEDYMGEKKLNQVFPWDFIDLGTTKEFLKEQWLSAKEATAQEDTFGCFNRCSSCRACHTFAEVLPSLDGKDYLVTSWHKRQTEDEDSREFVNIINKAKKPNVQKYKLKIFVDQELRYLDRNKIKLYLNRAYIRTGFPARQTMTLTSDKIRFQNWSYGVDYVGGFLHEKLLEESKQDWAVKLNAELEEFGVKVLQLEFYSPDLKDDETFEFVLYEVSTDFPADKVRSAIQRLSQMESLVVKIKVPGRDKGLWETVDMDVRSMVNDVWFQEIKGHCVIRCTMSDRVGPYEVFPTLFETSQKAIKRFPVKRLEYLKKKDEHELDMFAETCSISGEQIETNIFDQPISTKFSVRHLPFDLATDVHLGVNMSDEQMDALAVDADNVAPDADEVVEVMINDGESDKWDGIQGWIPWLISIGSLASLLS